MFDCVLPTRNARNGWLFTRSGEIKLRNARYRDDLRPLDEACACYTCRTSRAPTCTTCSASNEMLGARLNTLHNLHYYQELMADLRAGHRSRPAASCRCVTDVVDRTSGPKSAARVYVVHPLVLESASFQEPARAWPRSRPQSQRDVIPWRSHDAD